jgi:hypothetical protein
MSGLLGPNLAAARSNIGSIKCSFSGTQGPGPWWLPQRRQELGLAQLRLFYLYLVQQNLEETLPCKQKISGAVGVGVVPQ